MIGWVGVLRAVSPLPMAGGVAALGLMGDVAAARAATTFCAVVCAMGVPVAVAGATAAGRGGTSPGVRRLAGRAAMPAVWMAAGGVSWDPGG